MTKLLLIDEITRIFQLAADCVHTTAQIENMIAIFTKYGLKQMHANLENRLKSNKNMNLN